MAVFFYKKIIVHNFCLSSYIELGNKCGVGDDCDMQTMHEIIRLFSLELRNMFMNSRIDYEKMYEVRLRVNQPVIIRYENKEMYINSKGLCSDIKEGYYVNQKDMRETMEYISNFSLYAFEDEMKQGFITVQGGHRVGICGKIFLENNRIKNIKYISFINIRISHEVKGCAKPIIPYLITDNDFLHTLIISPPACGKTTLLRDLIRQLSDGFDGFGGKNVGVIDERSELAGSYLGIPGNDLGKRSDILDCCPKVRGIELLIRSMSPQIIAIDELGGEGDCIALQNALFCGCKILATIHGNSIEEIIQKPYLEKITQNKIFERYIVLKYEKKAGIIEGIYDRDFQKIQNKI